MSGTLHVRVYGTPAPQGSKRYVGRGVMVESSKAVKPWREAVKHAALTTLALDHPGTGRPLFTGPVTVEITFELERPRSHYGTGRNASIVKPSAPARPAGKPDLDKLLRSTFDALSDAGVWRDDSQVVTVTARKVYGDVSGALISIEGALISTRRWEP